MIPGLHDHHLHLMALAASLESVRVGPGDVRDAAGLGRALRTAAARALSDGRTWIRAVGYHESVAGVLDCHILDALVGGVALRVQHRSGAQWILNSAALAAVGVESLPGHSVDRDSRGKATGRLTGIDELLRLRWSGPPGSGSSTPDLFAAGRLLASYGVTGLTDATPYGDPASFAPLIDAHVRGHLPQRLTVTGAAHIIEADVAPLRAGPAKIVVADHDLPSYDELVERVRIARAGGRAVAVHCVTHLALIVTLAVLDEVGVCPGDRIEHAAVVDDESARRMAVMELTVVTQPNFVGERGDAYLRDVEPRDAAELYRCASLMAAGVMVAGSTDAPFGHPDPWRSIARAVDRLTESGQVLGVGERVSGSRALAMFLGAADTPAGPPRRITVGAAADLCLLDVALAEALRRPDAGHVVATVIAGQPVERG